MKTTTAAIYTRIQPSSFLMELPILIGFNILLIASSYISINVPLSPVPITGQTFGILLIAMTLGMTRGTGVVLAYLLEGAAGLPVFAGGSAGLAKFVGPTGGYLVGFLAAAYVVGRLADKGWDKGYLKSLSAMVIGTAIIFICGLAWLSGFVSGDVLLAAGLVPFIPGAIIKIALAFAILPTLWKTKRS